MFLKNSCVKFATGNVFWCVLEVKEDDSSLEEMEVDEGDCNGNIFHTLSHNVCQQL